MYTYTCICISGCNQTIIACSTTNKECFTAFLTFIFHNFSSFDAVTYTTPYNNAQQTT